MHVHTHTHPCPLDITPYPLEHTRTLVRTYARTRTYTHSHSHAHTNTRTRVYTLTLAHTNTHTHIQTHTHIHAHAHLRIHQLCRTCTNAHTYSMFVCTKKTSHAHACARTYFAILVRNSASTRCCLSSSISSDEGITSINSPPEKVTEVENETNKV